MRSVFTEFLPYPTGFLGSMIVYYYYTCLRWSIFNGFESYVRSILSMNRYYPGIYDIQFISIGDRLSLVVRRLSVVVCVCVCVCGCVRVCVYVRACVYVVAYVGDRVRAGA